MLQTLRAARELLVYVDDVRWLVNLSVTYGAAWLSSRREEEREVELIEKFRECRPLVHDPVIWSTECEFDRQEWVICPRSSSLPCEPRAGSCES